MADGCHAEARVRDVIRRVIISAHTAGRAHPAMFSKFQHETLFYIFYSMPGEEAQLYAADELIHRGWGFHKEIKAWLMRSSRHGADIENGLR